MTGHRTQTIHATLVRVFGVGVLIKGAAGTGKSECALELVSRGHFLVADDAVELSHIGPELYGTSPAITKGLIDIRDVGICDIREIFGAESVLDRCSIGVCVGLRPAEPSESAIAFEKHEVIEINGVPVPCFEISNAENRPVPLIIEAIVKTMGSNAESMLTEKYNKSVAS